MIKLYSNMTKVIAAQLFTQIMDRALLVGVIWYVVQNYDKSDVAIFLMIVTIPYIFVLNFSSVVINKFGILKVVYLTDILKSLLFLFAFIFLPTKPSIIDLIILFFITNFFESLFNPAILSLPKFMMDESNAHKMTAWLNSCMSIGAIIGPVFSLVIFHRFELKGLLFFALIFYFCSGVIELTIRINKVIENTKNDFCEMKNPFRLIFSLDKKILFFLILGVFMNLLFTPLQIFIPFYINHIMKLGMASYTHLQVVMGIGAIFGCLFISLFSKMSYKFGFLLACTFYFITTLFYILFSLAYSFNSVSVGIFGIEFFMNAGNVIVLSLYQKIASSHELPFIMSCVMFISVASAPLAMLISSFAINCYTVKLVVEFYSHISFVLMLLGFIAAIIVVRSKTLLSWENNSVN